MKRLIIVTAVIALVAVAVFGGQALAAKPTGSSVAIETHKFTSTYSKDVDAISINYPQVRHVSLTLCITGIDAGGDFVDLRNQTPHGSWHYFPDISSPHYQTYEFDTDNLLLDICDNGFNPITVSYYITTTYER